MMTALSPAVGAGEAALASCSALTYTILLQRLFRAAACRVFRVWWENLVDNKLVSRRAVRPTRQRMHAAAAVLPATLPLSRAFTYRGRWRAKRQLGLGLGGASCRPSTALAGWLAACEFRDERARIPGLLDEQRHALWSPPLLRPASSFSPRSVLLADT